MTQFVKNEVKKLKAYGVESSRPKIKLDANENPYDLPEYIIDKIKDSISLNTLNRYPDARASDLCNKLASYVGNDVDGDMIIVGDGSDELINIIISSCLSKGNSIVLPTPGFSMYNIYSSVNEADIIEFKRNENLDIDIDELIEFINIKKPGLVIVCNPNNPTGTLTPRDSIIKLVENCECMVVVDEAYYEFSDVTVIDLIDKYSNLIVLRTLSKAWGLAGLRLGYLITNKGLINELLKVKSPFNVNSITQEISCMLLDYQDYMDERKKAILEQRDYLVESLRDINNIRIYDTNANFVLIKVPDSSKVASELRKNEIAVRNFNNYQGLDNCIRITVGSREENEVLLNQLKKIMGE